MKATRKLIVQLMVKMYKETGNMLCRDLLGRAVYELWGSTKFAIPNADGTYTIDSDVIEDFKQRFPGIEFENGCWSFPPTHDGPDHDVPDDVLPKPKTLPGGGLSLPKQKRRRGKTE